jgi:hypothetical protein
VTARARIGGALLFLLSAPALAAPPGALRSFEAVLDSRDSATAALQFWCDQHHWAPGAKIVARRAPGAERPPTPEARQALGLKPGVQVRYRHVALSCGDKVLSEADNWYLPGRLTAEMNQKLDGSNQPFGAVVAPLGFHRRTLSRREMPPNAAHAVLRNTAVLVTREGAPFSYVVETYPARVLTGADRP